MSLVSLEGASMTFTRSELVDIYRHVVQSTFVSMRQREAEPETFEFGLSVLHARIGLLEFILHLSYKLPMASPQARSDAEKASVEQTKELIQDSFRTLTGLRLDMPRRGSGNTNDGNTSRRFFNDLEIVSEITGVDLDFLRNVKLLLEILNSVEDIDLEMFSDLCSTTVELYVSLYPWCPMSPTLHIILIHGPALIQHFEVPIGMLSEEAAETRNEHFQQFCERFTRKCSRIDCIRDILNRMQLTSDPLRTEARHPSLWKP